MKKLNNYGEPKICLKFTFVRNLMRKDEKSDKKENFVKTKMNR